MDIASGETVLDRIDLRLPGALPLVLARSYRSGAPAGAFGPGWRHGLERTLRLEAERIVHLDGAGRETAFAPLAPGMEARHPEGLTLQHHESAFVVLASPSVQEVFPKGAGRTLRLDRIEDASGNRLQFAYAGERLAEIATPSGRRVRLEYAGSLVGRITLVGPNGQAVAVRTFRYGAGGLLAAETNADGQTTEYAYHGGLLVRVSDPAGRAWLAHYDAERRCTALWRADGTDVRHLAYDPLRQTTRALGPDGRQTLHRHALGERGAVVIEAIDAAGESLNYYYDEAQRLIGHAAAGGTVVTFQRLDPEEGTRVQLEHEERFAEAHYGPSGLAETVADAYGNTFAFGYDERFNLVRLSTPLGAAWTFERDRRGRPTAIASPAGRRLALRHDGTVLSLEDAEGERLRLTTDLGGRLASRTDRLGRRLNFRYDAEGRLKAVGLEGGYQVELNRDRAGRLVRVADSERNDVRWTRDAAGRTVSLRTGQGTLSLGYDLAGRIVSVAGPAGEVRFGYDAQDRLGRAAGPRGAMQFAYDGNRVTVARGEERRIYSTLGDLLEEHHPDGAAEHFAYGPSGELIYTRRTHEGEEQTRMFEYDADGRPVALEHEDIHLALGYDADGLLSEVEHDGTTFRLEYDARLRPTAVIAAGLGLECDFDEGDRLVAVRPPAGSGIRVRYDVLDRPVGLLVEGGPERRPPPTGIELVPIGGEGEEGGRLALAVGSRGLALVARVGGLAVPLWGREEMRLRPLGLYTRLVRALVLGPEGVLASAPEGEGPPLARWREMAAASIEDGLPAAVIGLPWPVLDFFALDRRHLDPSHEGRAAGALPQHRADPWRSPDDALTGSHRSGGMAPPVWTCRAVGPALAGPAPIAPPGPIPEGLALRLYRSLTEP